MASHTLNKLKVSPRSIFPPTLPQETSPGPPWPQRIFFTSCKPPITRSSSIFPPCPQHPELGVERPVMGFLPLETPWTPLNTASQSPGAAPLPREERFPTFVFWGPSVQSLGVFLAVRLSLKIKKIKNPYESLNRRGGGGEGERRGGSQEFLGSETFPGIRTGARRTVASVNSTMAFLICVLFCYLP